MGFLSGKSFLFHTMQTTLVKWEKTIAICVCGRVHICSVFECYTFSIHVKSAFHLFDFSLVRCGARGCCLAIPHFSHYLLPFFNVTRNHNHHSYSHMQMHKICGRKKKWFGLIKWKRLSIKSRKSTACTVSRENQRDKGTHWKTTKSQEITHSKQWRQQKIGQLFAIKNVSTFQLPSFYAISIFILIIRLFFLSSNRSICLRTFEFFILCSPKWIKWCAASKPNVRRHTLSTN